MEGRDRSTSWLSFLIPVAVISTYFLALARWADPYRHGLVETGILALCYVSLAAAVHAGTLFAMRLNRAVGAAASLVSGALLVWASREELHFPASATAFAGVAVGVGVLYALIASRLAPRVHRRSAALVASGSVLALVGFVLLAFHGSLNSRWHLLQHNPLLGMPAYYGLAQPTSQVYDQLWARAQPIEDAEALPPGSHGDGRNVVFILIDTWRADSLSAYREDVGVMRRMDQLARDCVIFDDIQANSSWTRSSVASFFSGLRPEEHGATDRGYRLLGQTTTLAEVFEHRGYETAAFITNYANVGRDAGFDQGFETFEELSTPGSPYARADVVNEAVLEYMDGPRPGGRPLFLYIHYLDPHQPFLSGADETYGGGEDSFSHLHQMYAAELRFTDEYVPALVRQLRERLGPDTLYFITSDHGEELGEHGLVGHGHTLYRELTHLPGLLCAEDETARRVAGRLEARDFFDLLPRLASGELPSLESWVEGRDQARGGRRYSSAYVRSKAASFHRPRQAQSLLRSLETGDWKLVWSGYGETYELYESASDPEELENRASGESARVSRLADDLDTEIGRWSIQENDLESGDTFEQLKQLGYVE